MESDVYQKLAVPLVISIALLAGSGASADSWTLPSRQTFTSPSGRFEVDIYPKRLSSQLHYFDDKVHGRSDAGGVTGLRENSPRAVMYSVNRLGLRHRLLGFRLVNEVAPVSALVSDDGRRLVTFDNWHGMGYGDDVVVIYRSDGTLVRKFSLEELLTAEDVRELPRSISSRYWSAWEQIDPITSRLVLGISRCHFRDECHEVPVPLEIDLETGLPVRPRRHLLPHMVQTVRIGPAALEEASVLPRVDPECFEAREISAIDSIPEVPFEELAEGRSDLIPPTFSEMARLSRAGGRVVLEFVVDPDGTVACLATRQGQPLGMTEFSRETVRSWHFAPRPSVTRSFVAIDFVSEWVQPDAP